MGETNLTGRNTLKKDRVCRGCGTTVKLVWSRFLKGNGKVFDWFCSQKCEAQEQIKSFGF